MAEQSIMAPIDRPISRAYLRQFSGWQTAFPPGMSDPTSLRTMENMYITREGALRLRPGIRSVFTENWWLGNAGEQIVGSFEHFIYDTNGTPALLFAVKLATGGVGFRVVVYNSQTLRYDDTPGVFPQNPTFGTTTRYIKYLQIDNKIVALSDDPDEPAILFFVGQEKRAKKVSSGGLNLPAWTDAPTVVHPDAAWINGTQVTRPAAETATVNTLVHSTPAENTYSFAYFYTFETEFGESAPSGITIVKAHRAWSQWKFNVPDAAGAPSTTIAVDPAKAMDQFVAMLPAGQYGAAKSAGAIRWNLYQFTWNDTSPVPSVATLVASRPLTQAGTEATESWITNTAAALAESYIIPVPNSENRVNYSGAPRARQGIAAGDRLILVNDGANQAVIKWSSNVAGEYLNFSPSKGGGQKTLSSGNLLVPLNVQLWQNPQSTDTLVILCRGLDGYHAAYYMAPGSVQGQTDAAMVMGFEQTTAAPGSVAPYGVEVLNNALYRPLEAEVMKSVAANYSISHKTITQDIANKWQRLADKQDIVSSQHDGRLYYIVNNPEGEPVESGCMGNEIWVADVSGDAPIWSRWLIQGIALRKLQIGNKLYMTVVRPDAIFILDEMAFKDEYAEGASTLRKTIKWRVETNILGANRTHDVWAYVHQAHIHVGDWVGSFDWGIHGWDENGRVITKMKRSHAPQDDQGLTTTNGIIGGGVDLGDAYDTMLVDRTMMEWKMVAKSAEVEDGILDFYGQIDFLQFMLFQQSTNVGYEAGSLDTFEYRRNALNGMHDGSNLTRNGLPMPRDTTRP